MDEQAFCALTARLAEIEADPSNTDELIEQAGNIVSELIETPAPSPACLLWKLRYLLAAELGRGSGSWEGSFLAQTLTDCARFLGETGNV